MIDQFVLVQKASQHLYDALRSSCTKHTHHQAHFSLQPIPSPNRYQVRFDLGFRQFIAPASRFKQSVWFTVESTMTPTPSSPPPTVKIPTLTNLTQSIKRGRTSPSPPPQRQPAKLQKRRIRFELPSSCSIPALPDQHRIDNTLPPSVEPALLNLCAHNNFCNQLQNFLNRSNVSADCCIGYLEKTPDSKHLIYLRGQGLKAGNQLDAPLKSLADLLEQRQQGSDETFDISQVERLALSRSLAAAVLQFHPTPWLRNTWSSKDVFFLLQSDSSNPQSAEIKEPFVDVSVQDSSKAKVDGRPDPCYPFAPNDFLFGLGVMLIELAFQKPLQSMKKPCDTIDGMDGRYDSFFTAKRLSKLVSRKFGTRYGEIARKCLACDFGRGDDLGRPALQEAVYREVVCELTDLVGQFTLGS